MILRKHIEGGKILKIEQLGLERIILLSVQNYNEYGDLATLHLYLEIMGKHSNLILVDPQSGAILDGLKRYSHALSRHREVLPGRQYIAPPSQGKLDPLTHEEEWREVLFQEEIHEKVVDLLVKHYAGISPELAREIVTRAGLELGISLDQCGDIDLSRIFQAYTQLANPAYTPNLEPTLYYLKGVQPTRPNSLPTSFSFCLFKSIKDFPAKTFPLWPRPWKISIRPRPLTIPWKPNGDPCAKSPRSICSICLKKEASMKIPSLMPEKVSSINGGVSCLPLTSTALNWA